MSDWTRRLEAVATLGLPPNPKDGEVRCLNPTCRNEKLNRSDMTCWKCGMDRFEPNSEEMRHALRFNYVPPPRRVEKPKEPPPAPGISKVWVEYLYGAVPIATPTQNTKPAAETYDEALKRVQAEHQAAFQRELAIRGLLSIPGRAKVGDTVKFKLPEKYAPPAPAPSLASRVRGWFKR